ncbi:MAG: hypothetical protein FJ104_03160 [Deltaproteobacteria bacterium]|nr:hypothetical protein [Deltaproteobacteria bacterium]
MPQWSAGAGAGIGFAADERGAPLAPWATLGARADVLFGQKRPPDLGVGPAVLATTSWFGDARLLTGPTFFLPLAEPFGVGGTVGAGLWLAPGGAEPAIGARALLGARGFNYLGSYSMAGGVELGFDRSLGSASRTALSAQLQIDGALLAIPFLWAVTALRDGIR